MYGYIKLGCERVLASLVALGQVVDVWFAWLFAGWAPIISVMFMTTSKAGLYVWIAMVVLYVAAWLPLAASD